MDEERIEPSIFQSELAKYEEGPEKEEDFSGSGNAMLDMFKYFVN